MRCARHGGAGDQNYGPERNCREGHPAEHYGQGAEVFERNLDKKKDPPQSAASEISISHSVVPIVAFMARFMPSRVELEPHASYGRKRPAATRILRKSSSSPVPKSAEARIASSATVERIRQNTGPSLRCLVKL